MSEISKDFKKNRIEFSNKITFLQFALSILIVYQHTSWNYNGSLLALSQIHGFLFYLTQTAVPLFFMISGYLFYRTFKIEKAVDKLKSRIKTLVVPYLIWNVIYAVGMILLKHFGFVNSVHIENNWKLLLQILNSDFSPLWFVKYLIVFSLIGPLMYYVFKNKYIGAIAVVTIFVSNLLFCTLGIVETPINVNSNNPVMFNYQYVFYAIGAYSAIHLKEVVEKPNKTRAVSGAIILGILCVLYWMPFFETNVIVGHTFRLIFGIALWFACDFIKNIETPSYMRMSFFIYCAHLLPLQCLQAVIRLILNKLDISFGVFYVIEWIALPICLVAAIIFIGNVMKKYMPKVWNVLTGSRA